MSGKLLTNIYALRISLGKERFNMAFSKICWAILVSESFPVGPWPYPSSSYHALGIYFYLLASCYLRICLCLGDILLSRVPCTDLRHTMILQSLVWEAILKYNKSNDVFPANSLEVVFSCKRENCFYGVRFRHLGLTWIKMVKNLTICWTRTASAYNQVKLLPWYILDFPSVCRRDGDGLDPRVIWMGGRQRGGGNQA